MVLHFEYIILFSFDWKGFYWEILADSLVKVPSMWQAFLLLFHISLYPLIARWLSGKESTCQCWKLRTCGFDPWIRKIPWSRKWQSIAILLPGKFQGQRSLAGYGPWGCRVVHDWVTEHTCTHSHPLIWQFDFNVFWCRFLRSHPSCYLLCFMNLNVFSFPYLGSVQPLFLQICFLLPSVAPIMCIFVR